MKTFLIILAILLFIIILRAIWKRMKGRSARSGGFDFDFFDSSDGGGSSGGDGGGGD